MIERRAYQCEFCKKYKEIPNIEFDKEKMKKHELSCWYNPKNKTCFTCSHLRFWDRAGYVCSLDNAPDEYLFSIKCDFWSEKKEEK